MKTVVITGSARGLGYELAKRFRENNYNVVLSDINKDNLEKSEKELIETINSDARVISVYADVTSEADLEYLMAKALETFESVDVWINNAGVNQPNLPIWEVDSKVINRLVDIDLKSAIIGSKIAMKQMIKQGYGQIYGVEGYGSNDAMMLGLSVYGTSKRGLTYFFRALAKEVEEKELNIKVGLLSPGIMITDFITHSMGDDAFELPEKTKKVYNILGDYPDVISKFLVDKIVKNEKNGVRFNWLTNGKASLRFMTCAFNKRDFFKKED
jgi:NAD(P)-dependent dehydrogenase (short-subunit alcohol dehydrogenase family)